MGPDLDLGGYSKEIGILLEPEEWVTSGLVKSGEEENSRERQQRLQMSCGRKELGTLKTERRPMCLQANERTGDVRGDCRGRQEKAMQRHCSSGFRLLL